MGKRELEQVAKTPPLQHITARVEGADIFLEFISLLRKLVEVE